MEKRSSSMPDNEMDGLGDAPETELADGSLDQVDTGPPIGGDASARLEAAVAAEREKHLRLAAEFDNYRKRMIRERQEAGSKAQADLVQGLVEVLDDIMRFAHLDPATVDSTTVVQGVAMVERKVMKTLSGHGLEVIDPAGRPFDPAFHEAVGTEPAASSEEDHLVARVYQQGFLFRGQLLRPARVVVKQWLG
ncbi:MAG TPA: nucleotide exchange factor GrpE [Gemmatimonadaceae bacterium]